MNKTAFRDSVSIISANGFDGLFNGRDDEVIEIPLEQLHSFKDHPFHVTLEGSEMEQFVESIRESGVLVPITVRKTGTENYEIISGHRRTAAARMAGLRSIRAIVRNYTDDEAVIAMVDSNLQREGLLPSEKAFAYRMRLEAIKDSRKHGDGSTRELIAGGEGESGKTIQRYIRLTELQKELLQLVDEGRIKIAAGVELSYMPLLQQTIICRLIQQERCYPTLEMAGTMRKLDPKDDNYTLDALAILKDSKPARSLTLSEKKLARYFPQEFSKEKIEATIIELLDKWRDSGNGNVQD